MYISPTQKYEENVESHSQWVTATPSPAVLSLPFYICEAGHFYATGNYSLKREHHNSHLLIYTILGEGRLCSKDADLRLPAGCCAVIDCRSPHEYYTTAHHWNFLWLHFDGCGATPLLHLLYPQGTQTIHVTEESHFENALNKLLCLSAKSDIVSCTESSACMHALFCTLLQSQLAAEQYRQKDSYTKDITAIADYIRLHYSEPISIDDMIAQIPISKYHFIRLFKRTMGVTPYHYLTNYRINRSKILLRTTGDSVAHIAEVCGFADTSNFINQFKRHTGVRPTHYRKDFAEA